MTQIPTQGVKVGGESARSIETAFGDFVSGFGIEDLTVQFARPIPQHFERYRPFFPARAKGSNKPVSEIGIRIHIRRAQARRRTRRTLPMPPVRDLNNIVEQDHQAIKRRVRASGDFAPSIRRHERFRVSRR